MRILDNISQLLNDKGLKQKDLTDYLGISKNCFTDWKSGKSSSYQKYLPQIAEFLGVSVDYIVGNEESSTDDIVKFSLFGTSDVNDEIYEQVKAFAKFIMEDKNK